MNRGASVARLVYSVHLQGALPLTRSRREKLRNSSARGSSVAESRGDGELLRDWGQLVPHRVHILTGRCEGQAHARVVWCSSTSASCPSAPFCHHPKSIREGLGRLRRRVELVLCHARVVDAILQVQRQLRTPTPQELSQMSGWESWMSAHTTATGQLQRHRHTKLPLASLFQHVAR